MARARTQQPSYDFIAGGSPGRAPERQSWREPVRAANNAPNDDENEDFRKEIHKLRYEIDSLKQEKELTKLRHNEELRQAQTRSEGDFKKAQAAESAKGSLTSKHEQLQRDYEAAKEDYAKQTSDLERRSRQYQDRAQSLQEDFDEVQSQLQQQERKFQREIADLRATSGPAQQAVEEMRQDRDSKVKLLENAQQKIAEKEGELDDRDNEILKLKAQTGDIETLEIVKRELSEQVAHIQKLETQNSDQRIELKKLKAHHKSIDVMQEEKRKLETKIKANEGLQRELSEAQLQRQLLEDERSTWTSYLEGVNEAGADADGDQEMRQITTPEDLAKAYTEVRMEKVSLVDQLGKVQPSLDEKDEIIASLEKLRSEMAAEMDKMRVGNTLDSTSAFDAKAKTRLERQRDLAVKETEFLRAQFKAFDTEESELQPETYDKVKIARIEELEDLVNQYRTEIKSANSALDASREDISSKDSQSSPRKRQRVESPSAPEPPPPSYEDSTIELEQKHPRFSTLLAENKQTRERLTTLSRQKAVLEKDYAALKSQLKLLKSANRVRVLELRDNPAAQHAQVKQSMLDTLRAENVGLLERLEKSFKESDSKSKTVPQATLDRVRADLETQRSQIASLEKKESRLKSRFQAVVTEYRTAVRSLLGWDLEIHANGRTKLTSVFYPTTDGRPMDIRRFNANDENVPEEDRNWILFNGEEGTMKVSGGRQSRFAGEIREQLEYWVDGRGEVPCFLAACTMEFWEKARGTMRT